MRKHKGPHKYQRVEWGKNKTPVYRCMLNDCSHYVHPEFILGREALCWKCLQPFNISKIHEDRVRPKCKNCFGKQGQKPAAKGEDIDFIVDDLLKGL